jgi:hypothetical protein
MKAFLTLSLAGLLLAGAALGTLIHGTDEPVRQGLLFGGGIWLLVVGFVLLWDDTTRHQ